MFAGADSKKNNVFENHKSCLDFTEWAKCFDFNIVQSEQK